MGRDGAGFRSDLGQARSRIFFETGLDDPNHLERTGEIRFYARAIFSGSKAIARKARPINATDLPDGLEMNSDAFWELLRDFVDDGSCVQMR